MNNQNTHTLQSTNGRRFTFETIADIPKNGVITYTPFQSVDDVNPALQSEHGIPISQIKIDNKWFTVYNLRQSIQINKPFEKL